MRRAAGAASAVIGGKTPFIILIPPAWASKIIMGWHGRQSGPAPTQISKHHVPGHATGPAKFSRTGWSRRRRPLRLAARRKHRVVYTAQRRGWYSSVPPSARIVLGATFFTSRCWPLDSMHRRGQFLWSLIMSFSDLNYCRR